MGDVLIAPICQAVREQIMHTPEQSTRITTALPGRCSISMSAIVKAVNIAIPSPAGRFSTPLGKLLVGWKEKRTKSKEVM